MVSLRNPTSSPTSPQSTTSTKLCPFCITNATHPRLGRGETYGCGYKPYRCEICNYSTTTKGNLAIHEQSDKHLNNIRELGQQSMIQIANNYPTTSAMVKVTMKDDSQTNQRLTKQPAYNQFQSFKQIDQILNPLDISLLQLNKSLWSPSKLELQPISNPSSMDSSNHTPSAERFHAKLSETSIYPLACQVCCAFTTDKLESLIKHAEHIRVPMDAEQINPLITIHTRGYWLCRLCAYKSALKANFQLHCKTEKHSQRLSLLLHICEGGPANQIRMLGATSCSNRSILHNQIPLNIFDSESVNKSNLNVTTSIQLTCLTCDISTTSVHKFRIHCQSLLHRRASELHADLVRTRKQIYDQVSKLCHTKVSNKPDVVTSKLKRFIPCGSEKCLTDILGHFSVKYVCIFQCSGEINTMGNEADYFNSITEAIMHWHSEDHQIRLKKDYAPNMTLDTSTRKGGHQGHGMTVHWIFDDIQGPVEQLPDFVNSLMNSLDPLKITQPTEQLSNDSLIKSEVSEWGSKAEMVGNHGISDDNIFVKGISKSYIENPFMTLQIPNELGKRIPNRSSREFDNPLMIERPHSTPIVKLSNQIEHPSTRPNSMDSVQIDVGRLEKYKITNVVGFNPYHMGSKLQHISPRSNRFTTTNQMPVIDKSVDRYGSIWKTCDALKPVDELVIKCQLCAEEIPSSKLLFHMAIHFMNISQANNKLVSDELTKLDHFYSKYSRQLDKRKTMIDLFEIELKKSVHFFELDHKNIAEIAFLLAVELLSNNELQFVDLYEFVNKYWFCLDELKNDQMQTEMHYSCALCHYRFMLRDTWELHSSWHHTETQSKITEGQLVRCLHTLRGEISSWEMRNFADNHQSGNFLQCMIDPVVDPASLIHLASLSSSGCLDSICDEVIQSKNLNSDVDNTDPLTATHATEKSLTVETPKHEENKLEVISQPQRRSRTRLNEDQLLILRSYFDINNSPSEDRLVEICARTGLQDKVVKHWFRNTLFKERQRNKDNPYNFSIPPSTCLNLEEYEKTGKIEIRPSINLKFKNVGDDDLAVYSTDELKSSSLRLNRELSLEDVELPSHNEELHQSQTTIENDSECISMRASDTDSSSVTGFPLTPPKKRFCPSTRPAESQSVNRAPFPMMGQEIDPIYSTFGNYSQNSNVQELPCSRNDSVQPDPSVPLHANSTVGPFPNPTQDQNLPLDLSTRGHKSDNPNESRSTPFKSDIYSHTNLHLPPNLIRISSPPQHHHLNINVISSSSSAIAAAAAAAGSRRNRTSITVLQSQCMHAIYTHHKTPSVHECDRLGAMIGLTRRVVQVWFQNQRAKEKKMARVTSAYSSGSTTLVADRDLQMRMKGRREMDPNYCHLCHMPITSEGIHPPRLDYRSGNCQFGETNALTTHATFVDHLFSQIHLKRLISCCTFELNQNGNV